ncbi:multicopper oxidase family protein [Agromyces bauzanensis]|uniref:Oxidase (Copper-binding protein) n=1 Tax=Agromyces bauzanensis TaxID=1308924 RepID=A0A917UXK3_9MICO|nr:multicopper oxidase family protein [Agromyces bauzanensis]GGJ93484.1 putative oxidase (copper-binding protein) [Agromyces bauzanensis]
MTERPFLNAPMTRRAVLGAGLAGAATVLFAACTPSPRYISPTAAAVGSAEAAWNSTGRIVATSLHAQTATLDLAGTPASTWSFGSIPAPVIRASVGDTIEATLANGLPEETTIHWHGVALRNDMDGVPGVTQTSVAAGDELTYRFIAPDAGTYWFHPHVGTQLDRGLYGALIIEDPNEPLAYDEEWVVIFDDWLDGVTATPPEVLEELRGGMAPMEGMEGMVMPMGNMLMGTNSDLLGGDSGDVFYPHYLVNGRPARDPETYTSRPGMRVRIRMINAGSDTAFRVALGGHRLTITHSDGFPVQPTEVDGVLLGMGERHDVLVTLADGVFPLVAEAEGKAERAFALVRTGAGAAPESNVVLPELRRNIGVGSALRAVDSVALAGKAPDREINVKLTGSMQDFDWAFDGVSFDPAEIERNTRGIRSGERVRVRFENTTTMWHPIHLHGHTFQLLDGGPRKDTSIVLPGETLTVDFDANNPGRWLFHCHNIYHAEGGMTGLISYEA